MALGGKREGAGRKPGSRTKLQQTAIDISASVLKSVDAEKVWQRLLTCDDNKVVADVMKYLTNRVHGMPAQMIAGDPTRPIAIVLNFGAPVEW